MLVWEPVNPCLSIECIKFIKQYVFLCRVNSVSTYTRLVLIPFPRGYVITEFYCISANIFSIQTSGLYSRLSLIGTSGDSLNMFILSAIRINRSHLHAFV